MDLAAAGRSAVILQPLLLLLLFVGENLSLPFKVEDVSNSCSPETECMVASACAKSIDLHQFIFPCSDYGEPLKICCPKLNNDSSTVPLSNMSDKIPVSVSTLIPVKASSSSTTTTTTKPTIATPLKPNSRWSKFPKNLREKAKLLPDDTCGPVSLPNKIIGGQNSDFGQFPWMALIGDIGKNGVRFWCGGTLINKRYILTAAHCGNIGALQPKIVRLGEWNVSSAMDCMYQNKVLVECTPTPVDIEVEEVKLHEKFGDPEIPSYQNDVAIIRLAKDVEFSDFVKPICLPSSLYKDSNTTYTISGWGVSETESRLMTPVLQFASIHLYDFKQCNTLAAPEARPLAKSQFCAGGEVENACKGDSGGPLMYTMEDKVFQKGVVSLATDRECTTEGKPSIYSEVFLFVKWILENIR